MSTELSTIPAWLPVAYLTIHTALVLYSTRPASEKIRFLLFNSLLGLLFIALIAWLPGILTESLYRYLLLWTPVIFFWAAYLWAKYTLTSVFSKGQTFDRELIELEQRLFGQPSLWWARKGNLLISELLHIAYSSYYFYTLVMGIFLEATGQIREFQAMTFAVMFGYLVSYPLFALTPVYGPRWGLVDEGLLGTSEQLQRGYYFTRFTNWLMFRGPAHKGGAMPSSHSSTALIFMVWSWRAWPPEAAMVATVLGVGMWIGSIYGRYHYVADVVVGALIGILGILAGDYLLGI